MNKTLIIFSCIIFTACHTAKDKANDALKKTGETIAEGTSEFVKGVKQGINKAFDSEIDLSGDLKEKGLQIGKTVVADSSGAENVLSVYIIFNKDFDGEIVVKAIDKDGLEYGRVKRKVSGKKDNAGYVDFYFPGRTSFESKSRFVVDLVK